MSQRGTADYPELKLLSRSCDRWKRSRRAPAKAHRGPSPEPAVELLPQLLSEKQRLSGRAWPELIADWQALQARDQVRFDPGRISGKLDVLEAQQQFPVQRLHLHLGQMHAKA